MRRTTGHSASSNKNALPARNQASLPGARKKIDQIDKQIAHLVKQRVLIANQILKNKTRNGKSLIDPKREKEILQKYRRTLGPMVKSQSLSLFLKSMRKLSRLYPQK